jgi:hypothetical protein
MSFSQGENVGAYYESRRRRFALATRGLRSGPGNVQPRATLVDSAPVSPKTHRVRFAANGRRISTLEQEERISYEKTYIGGKLEDAQNHK